MVSALIPRWDRLRFLEACQKIKRRKKIPCIVEFLATVRKCTAEEKEFGAEKRISPNGKSLTAFAAGTPAERLTGRFVGTLYGRET